LPQVIEENKALLKDKYDEAKALGAAVNTSRARINKLKSHIEQIRVERAMQGLSSETGVAPASDPEEDSHKASIESEKEAYKAAFNRLKELKVEIEHLQLLLEQSRKRLQKDFDGWFLLLERQGAAAQPAYAQTAHAPPAGFAAAQPHVRGGERSVGTVGATVSCGPQLTGNPEVDAEILAFYKARESLLQVHQR
jgi:kinesin family protein 6/9